MMFEKVKTEGIVLARKEIGEADCLFSVYTKDFGKIEALAKGVRKINAKLAGHLKILSLTKIEIVGNRFNHLTGASTVNNFSDLRKTPEQLSAALKIADLVDKFVVAPEKDNALWRKILECLNYLNIPRLSAVDLNGNARISTELPRYNSTEGHGYQRNYTDTTRRKTTDTNGITRKKFWGELVEPLPWKSVDIRENPCTSRTKSETCALYFQAQLLKILGYQPEVKDKDLQKLFAASNINDVPKFDKEVIKRVQKWLDSYIDQCLQQF